MMEILLVMMDALQLVLLKLILIVSLNLDFMTNAIKHVVQQIVISIMDFKNVTMHPQDINGLIILMLLKMDVTRFVESNEDFHVCLAMKIKQTLVLKYVGTGSTLVEQDGQLVEAQYVMTAIIMQETVAVQDVLLRPTMMEEPNLDFCVHQGISWLQTIAMNGAAMEEDLMIQTLLILDETCFD